jgi:hypothetical protein
MKNKQELVLLYTRINGVVKVKVDRKAMPAGMSINREFHDGLGLKVGER